MPIRAHRGRTAVRGMLFASAGIAPTQAPLVATRLDAANVAALAPGGVDATAGIGDFALSNGVLCAVVSDSSRESDLAPFGGALIDLGHCGRGDDQLVVVQPLANLDRAGAVRAQRVAPVAASEEARVETSGKQRRLRHRDRYALDLREPTRLRIATRVVRRERGARLFAIGDIALQTQHALRPFALDSRGQRTQRRLRTPRDRRGRPALDCCARRDRRTRASSSARRAWSRHRVRAATRRGRAPARRRAGVALPMLSLSAESFFGARGVRCPVLAQRRPARPAPDAADAVERSRSRRPHSSSNARSGSRSAPTWRRSRSALLRHAAREWSRRDVGARLLVWKAEDAQLVTAVRPKRTDASPFAVPRGAYDSTCSARPARDATAVSRGGRRRSNSATSRRRRAARSCCHVALRCDSASSAKTERPIRVSATSVPPSASANSRRPSSAVTRDVSLAGAASDPTEIEVAPGAIGSWRDAVPSSASPKRVSR